MFVPVFQQMITALALIATLSFVAGRVYAVRMSVAQVRPLASLSVYYGWYCALGSVLPALCLGMLGWLLPVSEAALSYGLLAASIGGAAICFFQIKPALHTQRRVESLIRWMLFGSAAIAILTTIGIIFSLIFETGRFFASDGVSITEFFFGLEWSAQTNAAFGAVPLFFGTIFVAVIALVVAVPIGVFAAIYLAEYASARRRKLIKPVLEILAGIPTVVYGFFAILVVAPFVRDIGMGLNDLFRPFTGGRDLILAQPKSALAAGLVMGVMIIPLVSSLADDVIRAVPDKLGNGAYGIGATRAEVMKDIILPAAFPGLMASFLLAASRAIGETMIVVMAAGERANPTLNPFEDVTTVTVQIVALMTGDPEFDSPRTLSAFALGFALFVTTLAFNALSQWVVDRQRRRYAGL